MGSGQRLFKSPTLRRRSHCRLESTPFERPNHLKTRRTFGLYFFKRRDRVVGVMEWRGALERRREGGGGGRREKRRAREGGGFMPRNEDHSRGQEAQRYDRALEVPATGSKNDSFAKDVLFSPRFARSNRPPSTGQSPRGPSNARRYPSPTRFPPLSAPHGSSLALPRASSLEASEGSRRDRQERPVRAAGMEALGEPSDAGRVRASSERKWREVVVEEEEEERRDRSVGERRAGRWTGSGHRSGSGRHPRRASKIFRAVGTPNVILPISGRIMLRIRQARRS
ncbi:hypothetical protein KM043_001498 [Ampulex compressa]|nr:hypothetical protein KM043_001498 [Ampulex compressa]